jgi:hypothetical protein
VSARQPKDAVPGEETVRVPQDLINGTEFKGIELEIDYKSVLALTKATCLPAGRLIKPFEVTGVFVILKCIQY